MSPGQSGEPFCPAQIPGVASAFREADIEGLGPKENCYPIGPPRRVERRVVSFTKASPLANQLGAWKRARAKVEESILGFQPDRRMVVDPDSWITQHGVLPIAEEPYCEFFESRSCGEDSSANLVELAGDWAGLWTFFGGLDFDPFVLSTYGTATGSCILTSALPGKLASVSFSVDGRSHARVGAQFEDKVLELLRDSGYCTLT